MDGETLWHRVGARHPALARRMLFVSGDTLAPDAREFFERSGCGVLDKPFSKADLLQRVAELLADGAAPGSVAAG
jgi:two-component system NtrC family sensor kinase